MAEPRFVRGAHSALDALAQGRWGSLWFLTKMGVVYATAESLLRFSSTSRAARVLRVPISFVNDDRPAQPAAVEDLPGWALWRLRRTTRLVELFRPKDGCLRSSLLGAYGIRSLDPVVRIGSRGGGADAFQAHAWIEVSGRSIGADESLVAFVDPSGAG